MEISTITVKKIGVYDVFQRTSDGMFNATKFLKKWNSVKDNPKRNLKDFWKQGNIKQFLMNIDSCSYEKNKASRGLNAGTWMRYDLFFYFTMWISPYFHYHVIKLFLENGGNIPLNIDEVEFNSNTFTYVLKVEKFNNIYKIGKTNNIKQRIINLSEYYGNLKLIYLIEKNIETVLHIKYKNKKYNFEQTNELFYLNDDDLIDLGIIYHKSIVGEKLYKSAQKLEGVDFAKIAKALNYVVFGKHDENLRQLATKEQLKELSDLQSKLAFSIDMGYIRTADALINEMRRIYDMKYNH